MFFVVMSRQCTLQKLFLLDLCFAAARDRKMKKSILAVCLGLAGFWSVQAEDSPIADPEG